MEKISDLIAIATAAAYFNTSKQNLYNLHNAGKITLKKLGRRTFVNVREFESAMEDLPRTSKQSA